VWLAANASAFVTGVDLPVDGGLTARSYSITESTPVPEPGGLDGRASGALTEAPVTGHGRMPPSARSSGARGG
jgi:hypothetical protein